MKWFDAGRRIVAHHLINTLKLCMSCISDDTAGSVRSIYDELAFSPTAVWIDISGPLFLTCGLALMHAQHCAGAGICVQFCGCQAHQ